MELDDSSLEINWFDSQCSKCRNLFIKTIPECKAFKNIPERILTNKIKHSEPLPDQENEIVFEPIEEI